MVQWNANASSPRKKKSSAKKFVGVGGCIVGRLYAAHDDVFGVQLEERMRKAETARDKAAASAATIEVDSEVLMKYTRMIKVGVPLMKVSAC